jgi:hypothetical protein
MIAMPREVPPRRVDAAVVALLLGTFLALGGHIVRQVIAYPLPGGWDGTAHYAVTELYVRNHFPLPDGWMPEYFGGMAFPDYYPPLLYWISGGLATIGVPTAAAMSIVFLLSTVAIPLVSYSIAIRLGRSRLAAALSSIIVVALLVDGGEQARFGIAIRGTFSVGLASHVLGYAVMLGAIRCALARRRRVRVLGTAGMLALGVLANLHVTVDLVIVFGLAALFQLGWSVRRERFDLVVAGAIAALASCLFWLPLLAESRWLPTYAMPPRFPGAGVVVPMAVAAGIGGWWAMRTRSAWLLAISLFVLASAALCVFDLAPLMPGAPLQPWRIAAAGIYLAPIAVAPALAALLDRGRLGRGAVAVGLAAYALTLRHASVYEYPLTTARERTYDRVFAALANRPTGRVLAEAGGDGADAYALQVLLPLHGHDSATGVFREASLGSLFAAPVQTRFSESARVFGLDSKVDVNVLLELTEPARLAAMLRAFDITHVVAHSARIKALVATIPGARALGGTDYTVYEMPWPSAEVVLPAHAPVLVATNLEVKRRTGTVDYMRLSEELLARGVFDYPTALQHGCAPADPAELAKFRALLVLEPCGDPAVVDATLRAYVAGGGVVIASLRAAATLAPDLVETIAVIPYEEAHTLRFYDAVVAAFAARVPALALERVDATVTRERVAVDLPEQPLAPLTPVVVRATFHPSWVASRGELYLGAFGQMIVLTDGDTVLTHERSRGRVLGLVVSFLALVGGVFAWRRTRSWA